MTTLVIQTILLIVIAFILGAIIGSLLRRLFGSSAVDSAPAKIQQETVKQAQHAPAPAKAPKVPLPPIPAEPVTPVEKAEVAPVPPAPLAAASPAKSKSKVKKQPATKPDVMKAGEADNLKLIRGIGPQNERRLNDLGITTLSQIASWSARDEEHFGDVLAFPGRIEREEWVSQAKVLAGGGATEFSKRVKSGEVESSMEAATAGPVGSKPANILEAARDGKADNLTLIDGVGNALEKKLFKLGIFHFDQVASLSEEQLTWLGNAIGFPGRPERENWQGEAKTLAAGGATEHSKRVEKGAIKTSRKS